MSTISAPSLGSKSEHDRVSVGFGILSAVRAVYGPAANLEELAIVLIGHDRGARVAQRLVTSSEDLSPPVPRSLEIRIIGALLLDIVPYTAQWNANTNPRNATRYWHWSFLPAALSVPMVQAYGGGRFCREILNAVVGSSEAGRKSFLADDAIEHYARCYERDEVIRGGAADYSAGAAEDWDAQQEDIKNERKIQVPTVVLYCEGLRQMHGDVEAIWKQWASPKANIRVHALQGGVGHYLPEEAPEETNKHIVEFLQGLGL